ncbi:hypothetical protein KIN20_016510 [Parelaphostrongylus tenuis]|uniref:Uncharacterized protein n=1 Tax=Parelaphostrongylus tenuis TaxID=148309 RepID=A0AAD5MHH6_PARTN|nr:hypothetical protein KIN20_016510 [Parelaphostrongylus tenuis]
MSTLAGFDAIANQNVITGLTSVPNQLVMDGSRLFAGNPSLPCGAATTTYGSGHHHHHHHFDAALFSEAFQYAAAAAAATTAASHAPFHPFAAPPPIYSPSPSGNNNNNNNNNSNLRSIHDMTISSQTDEDCSFNDDEDSSILSNLPNSCHDFELKELHIRLERNHSSPLVGGHSSPALSSRLSSNCPSTEPPTDPAEPEDLEVQFINECFEEQQRQSQMYQSGDLKSLFYHGSSELDSSKVTYRSVTDKSMHSSLERPERLPYAKKLSSLEKLVNTQYDCRPLTPASFLNFSENFEPLIDQKPEALIISQTREEQKTSPCRRRVSEPLTQKPILFWTSSLRADSSYLGSGDMFGPVKS